MNLEGFIINLVIMVPIIIVFKSFNTKNDKLTCMEPKMGNIVMIIVKIIWIFERFDTKNSNIYKNPFEATDWHASKQK